MADERIIERTQGTLLAGRVRHDQAAQGFRTGIEPVFLAAAVRARAGERVLEAGCGSGAAILCLAKRIAGVEGVGVDRAAEMVRLARDNARANGYVNLRFVTAEIERLPLAGGFDHAFANPPYHVMSGTVSPNIQRDRAKRAEPGLFGVWAKGLAATLRHRGTLTFILPAAHVPVCLGAMIAAGCAIATLIPLWRGVSREAGLVIVRAVRGGRMPMVLHPGLALHHADGRYTRSADAVLSDGLGLDDVVGLGPG